MKLKLQQEELQYFINSWQITINRLIFCAKQLTDQDLPQNIFKSLQNITIAYHAGLYLAAPTNQSPLNSIHYYNFIALYQNIYRAIIAKRCINELDALNTENINIDDENTSTIMRLRKRNYYRVHLDDYIKFEAIYSLLYAFIVNNVTQKIEFSEEKLLDSLNFQFDLDINGLEFALVKSNSYEGKIEHSITSKNIGLSNPPSTTICSHNKNLLIVAKNSPIYRLDLFCSAAEDFFSISAAIPILGTVPALLRIAFGAVQFITAVTASAISLFLYTSSAGKEILSHSLRHIFHGLVNILAGILQAIPFIGSIIYGIKALKEADHSDAGKIYINNQKHKFFGYKTIRDNTWACYQAGESKSNESILINDGDLPKEAMIKDVIIAAV